MNVQVEQIGTPSLGIFERIIKVVENIYRICISIFENIVELKSQVTNSSSYTHPDSGVGYDTSELIHNLWEYFFPADERTAGFFFDYGHKIELTQQFFNFYSRIDDRNDFFPNLKNSIEKIEKFFSDDIYWINDPMRVSFFPDVREFIRCGISDFFTSGSHYVDSVSKRQKILPDLARFLQGGRHYNKKLPEPNDTLVQINDIWEFFNRDIYSDKGYDETGRFFFFNDMFDMLKAVHDFKTDYLAPIKTSVQNLEFGDGYTHRKVYHIMNVCRNGPRIGEVDPKVDFWNDNIYVQTPDLKSGVSNQIKWIPTEATGVAQLTFNILSTLKDTTNLDYKRLAIWLEEPTTATKATCRYVPRTMKVYDYHDRATQIHYWAKFKIESSSHFRICCQLLNMGYKHQLLSYDSDKYENFAYASVGPHGTPVQIGATNYEFIDECDWDGGAGQGQKTINFQGQHKRDMANILAGELINIQPLSEMVYVVHDGT